MYPVLDKACLYPEIFSAHPHPSVPIDLTVMSCVRFIPMAALRIPSRTIPPVLLLLRRISDSVTAASFNTDPDPEPAPIPQTPPPNTAPLAPGRDFYPPSAPGKSTQV